MLTLSRFMDFLSSLNTPSGVFVLLLALGVVFVNGFTDAPNAIATTVATGALTMNRACALCAVCNLVGLLISSLLGAGVARSVFESADFANNEKTALIAVFSCVVIFSLVAWLFAMPSSESHALLSAIAGASLALSRDFDITPFFKIVLYMILSCVTSLAISCIVHQALKRVTLPYERLQIVSCAITSTLHGAQDGQKFVGILLFLCPASSDKTPLWIILAVCIALFLGTLLGGGRIVKSMGSDITTLKPKSAFVSDVGASICLGICSALGLPVSTSNIKACSVAVAGLCDKQKINGKTLVKMAYVALLTFPICMALGYLITMALV